jgi:hypothetical protein
MLHKTHNLYAIRLTAAKYYLITITTHATAAVPTPPSIIPEQNARVSSSATEQKHFVVKCSLFTICIRFVDEMTQLCTRYLQSWNSFIQPAVTLCRYCKIRVIFRNKTLGFKYKLA